MAPKNPDYKHMRLSPDTGAVISTNNLLIQLNNNQCLCNRGAEDRSVLWSGVWSPPNSPSSTVQTTRWSTQLLLFIVSAQHTCSRKWLVKCYLFEEAEAAWNSTLIGMDGTFLGGFKLSKEYHTGSILTFMYVLKGFIPSCIPRNYVPSMHLCNSWDKARTSMFAG